VLLGTQLDVLDGLDGVVGLDGLDGVDLLDGLDGRGYATAQGTGTRMPL